MSHAPLHIIESHTAGEPTKVIIDGGPDLGTGTLAERSQRLRDEHAWLRGAVCCEPRGHEAVVGALVCAPDEPDCACGVIFFNNVSTLGMCIHATIGLTVTLAHLGRIHPGTHRIDTPVGVVTAHLRSDGSVEVANVPSYRHAAAVTVEVPGWGSVRGDVAWGGNWFFLIADQGPPVAIEHLEALNRFTRDVRRCLTEQGITGEHGMEIDHIEVFGPPANPALADSRNYVLCPGDAHDRSPCGTGTSAKLACLHASGTLRSGQIWRQSGILDTVFEAALEPLPDGKIIARITGHAWVNADSTYFFDPTDPFRHGLA
ncbi:MAG: hydroxyproline-2-epimerase [Verrucomicrobia bacterium]|nr:MAG: hydroxyproline-2-epimerase [Verrucomicrobiota bacterium]